MKRGVVKKLGPDEVTYYTAEDVMMMLGISKSKAYAIIKKTKAEYQQKGMLSPDYPAGKIPKKLINERFMVSKGVM